MPRIQGDDKKLAHRRAGKLKRSKEGVEVKKSSDLPEKIYHEVEKTAKKILDKDEVDPRVMDLTAINRLAEEQKDKGEFFANFYSLLVFSIADRTALDKAKAWVEFIEEIVAEQAEGQEKPEEFLGNFYSLIVEYIAMSRSMDRAVVDSWMDFIEESVEKRSKDQKDPEEFMQNFYSMVLTKLVEVRLISVSSEFLSEDSIEGEKTENR